MPDMVTLSLAKKYALKMNNVGVESAVSDENGITWTLKDGTTLSMSISNWHNLKPNEQLVLSKLVPISNDGGKTYLGTDLNRYPVQGFNQINDNKSYTFTASGWTKVSDSEYYKDIRHGKNNLNIIPTIVNDNNEGCTEGWKIIDADTVRITSTSPFFGRVILNYSVSNSNALNNIATVSSSYIFTSISDRDTYFGTTNISSLQNGLVSIIKDGTTETLYTWEGEDKPLTYDASLWHNSTALLKGEKGDQGIQGIQGERGESVYDFAVSEQGFSGTLTEYLESINSCLGKFSSLADLKIAYPVGIDKYKFAIIETISGQVGIAFYDKNAWDVTVFASTNGSSVVRDDKSITVNSMGNMELFGYEEANVNTIPCKYSDGTIKYLVIEKDSTNAFTSIASKEYVTEAVVGGLSIQNDYYDASTNTPNITAINTNGKSFAWIVSVAGTQTLGGNSETFAKNDLVIKTNNNGYLKIHNASVSWGSIIGDISQQTDMVNLLATYCKIDDTDTTSATKTYSIKHILSLLNGHRKIFIQSDNPIDMVVNDLWLDITNSPYTFSRYDGSVWRPVGKSAGTIINDWVGSVEYKSGEYSIHNSLLYKCVTTNSDAIFNPSNWNLISGHIIRDNTNFYVKRSNLQFVGNGVSVTDDASGDNTIITVNADVTKTGTQTLTNKSLVDSNTKIIDEVDNTKVAQFEANGISTATTRTYSLPNKDGTMALLSDIKTMTGATATTDGISGNVPLPQAGQQNSFLCGDGTWNMPIIDKTSNGYFDIGTMRIQWGNVASGSNNTKNVTFSAPFANSSYGLTIGVITTANATVSYNIYTKTSTGFTTKGYYLSNSGANDGYSWVAIGIKA